MFHTDERSPEELIASIPPERRIDLIGPLHAEAAAAIISELSNQSLRARDHNDPVLLQISTEGGHYRQGVRLYEALRMAPVPVIGLAVGQAHSTGLLVLQGCDLRIATAHTRFLVHHPFVIFKAHVSLKRSLQDWEEELRRIYREANQNTNEVLDIITRRDRRISRSKLLEYMNASQALTTEEALAAHLIDGII
jgi:ATP-dependent protease ClpP protease subunit